MVGAQDAQAVGEGLLVQGNGLAEAAGGLVSVCEVVAGGQGVGVVGAQDAQAVGEGLLVQGDGLAEAAGRFVGAGEVVAGGQGAGVVGAQDFAEVLHGVGQGQGRLGGSELRRIPQGGCKNIPDAGIGE